MHVILGSRRRFLLRMVIDNLAPPLGLYVFLANPDGIEGRLLGLIAIGIGFLALYLLFARLQDPWSAIRYAIRPRHIVSDLIAGWHLDASDRDPQLQQDSLGRFLSESLPDVNIQERSDSEAKQSALALGEDLLVYISSPLTKFEDIEALRVSVEKLRTPLHEEAVLIVLRDDLAPSLKAQLVNSLSNVRWLRVGS